MKRISSCHFLRIYHMGILLYCYYLVLKYHQTNINIKSWYQIRGLVPQTGTSKLVSSTLRATTRHLCCHEVLYLGPWDMFYCSPWDSYIHSDMIRYYLFRQDHFLACINFGYLSWFFNFHSESLLIVLLAFTNIYSLLQNVILKEQLLGLGIWSFPRLLNFINEQMDNNNINLYWEIRTNCG